MDRAERNRAGLIALLRTFSFQEADNLIAQIQRYSLQYNRFFRDQHALSKNVTFLANRTELLIQRGISPSDLMIVRDVGSLLHQLLYACQKVGAPPLILTPIEAAHSVAIRHFLSGASNQVEALCHTLLDIRCFLRQFPRPKKRVLLVEFPVGNSLPVALLAELLTPEFHTEILCVALLRNTSPGHGLTRGQLLEEQFEAARLESGDIVVYLDEWFSGSNFNALCELQDRLTNNAAFLPIAMLTESSASNERFESYRGDHDRLLQRIGADRADFRRLIPSLDTAIPTNRYFFWTEDHQMAGYRKFQLHGTLFSSIDASVTVLHDDEQAFAETAIAHLTDLTQQQALPISVATGIAHLRSRFGIAYKDYQACREALRTSADDLDRGGLVEDYPAALEALGERYESVIGSRDAIFAVSLALDYLRYFGSNDAGNPYHLRGHAPILVRLEGALRLTHQITMDYVRDRIRQQSSGS